MLRFNTFLAVVLTLFAFLLALGGGLLTAVRLTTPEVIAVAPARIIEQEARPFPAQPTRERASLVLPLLHHGESLAAENGTALQDWRY